MSGGKISSDEVPQKFANWLISMGCPLEKVPPMNLMTKLCRGQNYMVWRSLMEHVEPKDVIEQKRLQVFCDDIHRFKNANNRNGDLAPIQLELWTENEAVKRKVKEAKERCTQLRGKLTQMQEKLSKKIVQRGMARRDLQDAERRVWFLRNVVEEIRHKKENWHEAISIADVLCRREEAGDAQRKLEQCLSTISNRKESRAPCFSFGNSSGASTSVITNGDSEDGGQKNLEEHLTSFSKCGASEILSLLQDRKSKLVEMLASANAKVGEDADVTPTDVTPQSIQAQIAAFHCTLALKVLKMLTHLKMYRDRLQESLGQIQQFESEEACELLVLSSEKVQAQARNRNKYSLLEELKAGTGCFAIDSFATAISVTPATVNAVLTQVARLDKAIISKKEEIKNSLFEMAITERKIQNVRGNMLAIFNNFNREQYDIDTARDLQLEELTSMRRFYERYRQKDDAANVSMELGHLENSFGHLSVSDKCNTSSFIDELKFYLNNFCLEKNRKLVLDSGEKIWIFESLQSSLHRIQKRWLLDDVTLSLLSPSASVSANVHKLIKNLAKRDDLENRLSDSDVDCQLSFNLDIRSLKENGDIATDKIKKQINRNIISLQRTSNMLERCNDHIKYWSEEAVNLKGYISQTRYSDYETQYVQLLNA